MHRNVLVCGLLSFMVLDSVFKEMGVTEERISINEDDYYLIILEDIREPIVPSIDVEGFMEIKKKGRFTTVLSLYPQPPLDESFPFGRVREGFQRISYTMKQIPNPVYFKDETRAGQKIVTNEWECLDREVLKRETTDVK